MNKKKMNYKLIMIFIGIVAFIAGLYFSFNEELSVSVVAIKDIIYRPFHDVGNNREDVISEGVNTELLEENAELKKISGISSSLSNFKTINATVVERNHAYWLDTMTLNRGKKDGVDIGMAVVVSEGLVGKIISITNTTSVVRLITSTDNNNKISIKFKYGETYQYKVLELENNDLVIKGIDNDITNIDNVSVVTSGLSDIYPSGITIGKISKVESDKYGVGQKAYLTSSVDFDNLRFVSILVRDK